MRRPCADREEKRVTRGSAHPARKQEQLDLDGRKQEQLDLDGPNQRSLLVDRRYTMRITRIAEVVQRRANAIGREPSPPPISYA